MATINMVIKIFVVVANVTSFSKLTLFELGAKEGKAFIVLIKNTTVPRLGGIPRQIKKL